ncbi:MAG: carboxy terminal-processing peptidase [Porticoccaceae bacterium]|nr:carboxy terminal-processing peptidase [Porticoccaceae bacterium]MBT6798920.1 carboxy terminal-processing peptidase [Porticoccaceae bacterium]
MRLPFKALHTVLVLATLMSTQVIASLPIAPESGQSALYREIIERLDARHYRAQSIDDNLSERYLDQYVEMLDSGKSYFLRSDIEEFSQWRLKLDDLAKRGDLKPGFTMFNRLRDRAIDQLNRNITLLEDVDYRIEYDTDESIILDPKKRTWHESATAAALHWEKRIQDAMIRLVLNEKDPAEARELLIKRYTTQIKQYEQRNSQDVFQLYANALTSLYGPHSSYFTPRTNENFQINMSLSLEGIGAQLISEDDYTKVIEVIPGGPADVQGLLGAEDKIIGVGQGGEEIVDVIGWRIDEVVALIRGAKGTTVKLEVIPADGDNSNSITIEIVRDKVKLENKSAQSQILEIEQEGNPYKLGVIDIPAFYMDFEAYLARDPNYKSTTRDVRRLVRELEEQQVDGIVLDLRNNGGGSLREATTLTDLFINYGPVVQIRDAKGRVNRYHRASSRAAYSGPLLVLINRLSASASEILAGALQDYGRALVVGSQSFGKGTVQEVTGLSSGQLKLTISKFYRVSGDSTQHRGVLPDIAFPSAYDPEEVGESQQDNVLPWDSIHRVPHKFDDSLTPYLDTLTNAHQQRIQKDPDFIHLFERVDLSDSWSAEAELSLNLSERRARSEAWDKALFSLDNKRLKAKGLKPNSNIETWKEDREIDEDDIAISDPILFEAGQILGNQIRVISANNRLQIVQLEPNMATP